MFSIVCGCAPHAEPRWRGSARRDVGRDPPGRMLKNHGLASSRWVARLRSHSSFVCLKRGSLDIYVKQSRGIVVPGDCSCLSARSGSKTAELLLLLASIAGLLLRLCKVVRAGGGESRLRRIDCGVDGQGGFSSHLR